MRLTAVTILSLALTTSLFAQLKPGAIIADGRPYPVIADFNGDGLDDLIQERYALLSDGNAPTIMRTYGISDRELVYAAGDVNGDHRLDLLTSLPPVMTPPSAGESGASREYKYRLYLADASRNYGKGIDVMSGRPPVYADANGDGKDDLLIFKDIRSQDGVRNIATDVIVMLSNGDGTFTTLKAVRIGADVQVDGGRALAGDLNHDGKIDLVIRCTNDLVVLRGLGDGNFAPESRYLPFMADYGWWSARLADIDGDSNLDVVLPAFRAVRVFFGDGHGNFPRTARATITQFHHAALPAGLDFLAVDKVNQPRDLAIGHFTRADQNQIIAGTGEGDMVIIAYEGGQLREVSRTLTDFWLTSVRAGSFRTPGVSDVYAQGSLIWGEPTQTPRMFTADTTSTASTSILFGGRRGRATVPPALSRDLQMQMRGDCVDAMSDHLTFSREGIFGVAQRGDMKIEAMFDDGVIYARVTAPFALEPAMVTLTGNNNSYAGVADVMTACGWRSMTITASLQ